jgi:hypothetical protein
MRYVAKISPRIDCVRQNYDTGVVREFMLIIVVYRLSNTENRLSKTSWPLLLGSKLRSTTTPPKQQPQMVDERAKDSG